MMRREEKKTETVQRCTSVQKTFVYCVGAMLKKKKRNTLCSQPFSPDMVCFDAIQHSTVVSSSIPVQGRNLLANQSPVLARQHFLL
jgi:hypothetical protein